MPKRRFSRTFKLNVVRQLVEGSTRPVEVCRAYHLAPQVLARWRHDDALRGAAAFTPPAPATAADSERRIADLKRRCQQLTLENTILQNALPAGPTPPGMPG
jgi:transposase-like protein